MRRIPSVLAVGALALSTLAFAPAVPAPVDDQAPDGVSAGAEREIIVCVRFRDWEVPMTGITVQKPGDRFCIELPDVNPGMLPIGEEAE